MAMNLYLNRWTMGIGLLLSAALLTFTSCKPDEKVEQEVRLNPDEQMAANELFFSMAAVSDNTNIADESGRSGQMRTYRVGEELANCATVTRDTSGGEKLVRIDFGSTNCLCNDGRNRRGSISVRFTGNFTDKGTPKVFSYTNYAVNDHLVAGTTTLTFNDDPVSGKPASLTATNLTFTRPNSGGTFTWIGNISRIWDVGSNTPLLFSDDQYLVSGTAQGVGSKGVAYQLNILTPLRRMMNLACRAHFVSGTMDIKIGEKVNRVLDYGTGSCDDQATITVDGRQYNIDLP
jgi:hypothetical protein